MRAAPAGFHEKWNNLNRFAFINLACGAGHLERGEKTKDTDRVGTIENVQFKLYHESSPHLGNSACQVLTLIL